MPTVVDVSPTLSNASLESPTQFPSGRMLSLASSDDGMLVFAGSLSSDIWVSEDGGASFEQITWPQPAAGQFGVPGAIGGYCVVSIAVAPDSARWLVERSPRFLADITGDGRADIVGFGESGVWTALSNGDGTFADAARRPGGFRHRGGRLAGRQASTLPGRHHRRRARRHRRLRRRRRLRRARQRRRHLRRRRSSSSTISATTAGGWRIDKHPRFLADITGDGRADIIGFGDAGVYVAPQQRRRQLPVPTRHRPRRLRPRRRRLARRQASALPGRHHRRRPRRHHRLRRRRRLRRARQRRRHLRRPRSSSSTISATSRRLAHRQAPAPPRRHHRRRPRRHRRLRRRGRLDVALSNGDGTLPVPTPSRPRRLRPRRRRLARRQASALRRRHHRQTGAPTSSASATPASDVALSNGDGTFTAAQLRHRRLRLRRRRLARRPTPTARLADITRRRSRRHRRLRRRRRLRRHAVPAEAAFRVRASSLPTSATKRSSSRSPGTIARRMTRHLALERTVGGPGRVSMPFPNRPGAAPATAGELAWAPGPRPWCTPRAERHSRSAGTAARRSPTSSPRGRGSSGSTTSRRGTPPEGLSRRSSTRSVTAACSSRSTAGRLDRG